jgi:hypothetical protein
LQPLNSQPSPGHHTVIGILCRYSRLDRQQLTVKVYHSCSANRGTCISCIYLDSKQIHVLFYSWTSLCCVFPSWTSLCCVFPSWTLCCGFSCGVRGQMVKALDPWSVGQGFWFSLLAMCRILMQIFNSYPSPGQAIVLGIWCRYLRLDKQL